MAATSFMDTSYGAQVNERAFQGTVAGVHGQVMQICAAPDPWSLISDVLSHVVRLFIHHDEYGC